MKSAMDLLLEKRKQIINEKNKFKYLYQRFFDKLYHR